MIHQINPYTGETVRTWDTGEYWIDHRSFIDLVLIDQLGGEESAKDFDLKRIAEIVLTSPDGDHLVVDPALTEAEYWQIIQDHADPAPAAVDLAALEWSRPLGDIDGQIYQNAAHPEDEEYTISLIQYIEDGTAELATPDLSSADPADHPSLTRMFGPHWEIFLSGWAQAYHQA